VRLGRIIRFLSPMDRRWESKSSKALKLDAVLPFFGRATMPPGGVRPSGGTTVARLFFFKETRSFSSRIAKCFAWAGSRGTGFGSTNDRLEKSSAHEFTPPFSLEKVDLKAASFADGSEHDFQQCLDPLSS
jgi:hypothetical protein